MWCQPINSHSGSQAAWLRVEEKDILTIHHHVITRNYRINLINNQNDNRNFILHIKNVQESDRGGYVLSRDVYALRLLGQNQKGNNGGFFKIFVGATFCMTQC